MEQFKLAEFNIPKLKGISEKNIEEHLKLYAGYVKHANLILEAIEKSPSNELAAADAYASAELQRRFAFEFNGMRNHEYYFRSFEEGPKKLSENSGLRSKIESDFGSFDSWLNRFEATAKTRGIGWAMLLYDPVSEKLLTNWVDEQHINQLNGCKTILALDMWEHSFVADYQPSGKGQYIDDFFANLNWEVIETNFSHKRIA
ncbi:MAG: Fe-Mn family superoxide dismutase [bacterium]|nr:Fe-Mn family superoxide dismutase [bacterium]